MEKSNESLEGTCLNKSDDIVDYYSLKRKEIVDRIIKKTQDRARTDLIMLLVIVVSMAMGISITLLVEYIVK